MNFRFKLNEKNWLNIFCDVKQFTGFVYTIVQGCSQSGNFEKFRACGKFVQFELVDALSELECLYPGPKPSQ